MKIRYIGPAKQVEVPSARVVAVRGETIDVDPQIGDALVKQATWERVKARSKKATKE